MIQGQLRSKIMNILSNGATWYWADILALIEQEVRQGRIRMRTDDFPNGEERIPKYAMNAMRTLITNKKVLYLPPARYCLV